MSIKKNFNKKSVIFGAVAISFAIIAAIVVFVFPSNANKVQGSTNTSSNKAESTAAKVDKVASNPTQTNENGDIVIPISEVSDTVKFYSYDKLDTKLEILAVKAPDGTIRTAFNTCQVCYSSGRGYYVQKGDKIVCQNCGNQFSMSDIEKAKGGCNPVPIFDKDKKVDANSITIPKQLLIASEKIFKNWKK